MSRASQARRIATAAAYGGGGLGLLTAAGWGLLLGQAKLARRWVGPPAARPPVGDGVWGGGDGPELTFAVLGDLDFDLVAFMHGAEIRTGAREAVRAFLRGRER